MINYFLGEINSENLEKIFAYEGDANTNNLLNKDILKKLNLQYGIIYCYDRIITDHIDNLNLDLENIIEAIIFNEIAELKVWRDEDILKGCIFKELGSTPFIEEEYILYPRKTGGADPQKLRVKKYIDYDCDGQAYISYVKPFSFE